MNKTDEENYKLNFMKIVTKTNQFFYSNIMATFVYRFVDFIWQNIECQTICQISCQNRF